MADVSVLNFNVLYEIGYAIGKRRRVFLIRNKALDQGSPTIQDVGIFDTLGYTEYENHAQLLGHLQEISSIDPIQFDTSPNLKAPVYLLDTKAKTDFSISIVSRIRKARYPFRSFDPNEAPRLSAYEAIQHVAQSYGIVVPLLDSHTADHKTHNLRAAFVAGLGHGMSKVVKILQPSGESPVPIDYRDIVDLRKVPDAIAEFVTEVAQAITQGEPLASVSATSGILNRLSLGSSSAENEEHDLNAYYLPTEGFNQASRGEANLVVGRKGSGKSAIFFRIRDSEKNRVDNLILDLRPEDYQLLKFKENVLQHLAAGTFKHTITAFWEYVLLLEICHRALQNDKELHVRDHRLFKPYRDLADAFTRGAIDHEGDFAERLSSLVSRISEDFSASYRGGCGVDLSQAEVTDLIYKHDIRDVLSALKEYLRRKNKVWLLFDNIDKGWPSSGVEPEDLILIRALLDASRKIQQELRTPRIAMHTVVFLRNDVYELLVKQTADRGKEKSILLDWVDPDLLRELLRRRIVSTGEFGPDASFEDVWRRICVSHVRGEESSQFLIDQSLMRPRFLIDLISKCRSIAVDLRHQKIQEDDIIKGFKAYSTSLMEDISHEIADVRIRSQRVLYAFTKAPSLFSYSHMRDMLLQVGVPKSKVGRLIDVLLWYGFLGLARGEEETIYIYSVNYNMEVLRGQMSALKDRANFRVHPAFAPALGLR